MPTLSSTYSMPASLQAAASSSLILREASEMSAPSAQNSLKPSPVPGPVTDTFTSGCTVAKSSATATEMGSTVDEPVTTTSPEIFSPEAASEVLAPPAASLVELPSASVVELAPASVSLSLPQAAATMVKANNIVVARIRGLRVNNSLSSKASRVPPGCRRTSTYGRRVTGQPHRHEREVNGRPTLGTGTAGVTATAPLTR